VTDRTSACNRTVHNHGLAIVLHLDAETAPIAFPIILERWGDLVSSARGIHVAAGECRIRSIFQNIY
jgi:hypothetical protein